ncbi:MAG: hypothetical protein II008_16590 [Oscillospiraceae bacterium]|nr:hypothetical protein [Oscillospiraceae bacterium]
MKKFVAIGHWDFNKNITCAAGDAATRKEFEGDLKGNGFTAYMIFSEKKLNEYKAADIFGKMDMISSRNRHAIDIEDYMSECMDIIESKLAAI